MVINHISSYLIYLKYGTCINLPGARCHHKLSDLARRRLVREATKTPMATLKELKASAAEIGETLHTATFAEVLSLPSLPKACGMLQG